jgi:dynein assembly factor 1
MQINKQSLRKVLKEQKLYSSDVSLNDVIYLQCKGIEKLENLEEMTGLKALYLEQNAISRIEGLDALVNLR